jgi:hypothetical protein
MRKQYGSHEGIRKVKPAAFVGINEVASDQEQDRNSIKRMSKYLKPTEEVREVDHDLMMYC